MNSLFDLISNLQVPLDGAEENLSECMAALSEMDSVLCDTQINTEYLACLAELNMESEV